MWNKIMLVCLAALVAAWVFFFYTQASPVNIPIASSDSSASGSKAAGTYASDALGIAFQYDPTAADVREEGDRIEIYLKGTEPASGQALQRFAKLPGETLEQSIRRQFLGTAAVGTCAIAITGSNKYQGGYMEAEIDPAAGAAASACNAAYAKTDGVRFFLYDTNHPDRFYFFDIGQYAIATETGEPWQDTVTIR